MKRNFKKLGIITVLTVSMLSTSGCSSIDGLLNKYGITKDVDEHKQVKSVAGSLDNNDEMQQSPRNALGAVYSGEKIKVRRNEIVEFDMGYDYHSEGDMELSDAFEVYTDAALTTKVSTIYAQYNANTGKIEIDPDEFGIGLFSNNAYDEEIESQIPTLPRTVLFDCGDEDNHTWGNLPIYYLVSHINPETGKKLETPEITVIEIEEDIPDAPSVTYSQTEDGRSRIYWKPVDGADRYVVYSLGYSKESGYDITSTVLAITDQTEWVADVDGEDDFMTMNQKFHGVSMKVNGYHDAVYIGVLAVNSTGASAFSNMVEVDELRSTLPYRCASSKDSSDSDTYAYICGAVDYVSELPSTTGIQMCDDSVAAKVIEYDVAHCKYDENRDELYVNAQVAGTGFSKEFTIYKPDKNTYKDELEKIKERQDSLLKKGGDTLGPDVKITDGEPDESDESDAEGAPDMSDEPDAENTPDESDTWDTPDTAEEPDAEDAPDDPDTWDTPNTADEPDAEDAPDVEDAPDDPDTWDTPDTAEEPDAEDAPDKSDTEPTSDTAEVYGNSELSRYIATEMLQTKEAIDVSKFAESADNSALVDAFYEAKNQNPLILGVQTLKYDSNARILYVGYDYDADTTAQKQEEVKAKVNEVISSIITDGMSDLEKEMAINNYICEHAVYDDAACDNAEENDFYTVDEQYYDSFTAYGILINGVGVCASYAADFKLLADAAGLDSRIVTGMLEGSLPHAWNKVKIDGTWCIVDATNNDNDYMQNGLLNLSDDAATGVLTQNDEFVLDENIDDYAATSDENEYYHVNGKFFSKDEIASKLEEELSNGNSSLLRTDYDLDENEFKEIAQKVADESNTDLTGGYWFGMIYLKKK